MSHLLRVLACVRANAGLLASSARQDYRHASKLKEYIPKNLGAFGCEGLLSWPAQSRGCSNAASPVIRKPERKGGRVKKETRSTSVPRHATNSPKLYERLPVNPKRSKVPPAHFNNSKRSKQRLPDGSTPPWLPSPLLVKRKVYPRRMRHMLRQLGTEYLTTIRQGREHIPRFGAGDVINVQMVEPMNEMRPARFMGMCIGIKRNGPMTRFTVRNVVRSTGPVERSFLLYSPFIRNITVLRSTKVRRAKLTYLRKRKESENTFQW